MSFGIYEAKRLLRKPLIWYGRRRHADASEGEKWRLEHNAYRRVAMKAAGNVSIDPHFFYRADLDSSSIVIDIGAFRGHVAEQLYELYGCRLYAFEPSPQFYPELERAVRRQPEGGHTAVRARVHRRHDVDAAHRVRDRRCTARPIRRSTPPTCRSATSPASSTSSASRAIDYMKINIEGAEYDLLERLFETGWAHRVRYFLIQFHEWYGTRTSGAGASGGSCARRMTRSGTIRGSTSSGARRIDPHPEPPKYSKEDLAKIRAELQAQRAERTAAVSRLD